MMTSWTISSSSMLAFLWLCLPQASAINWIIFQTDDLNHLEYWQSTPPHFHNNNARNVPRQSVIPNIEKLRTEGVEFLQAHTASPMCGTSRYSTMTGRYASRSSRSRLLNQGNPVSEVMIPLTKLLDTGGVSNGADCSRNNMAVEFQNAGWVTSMIGKWHLSFWSNFDYPTLLNTVKGCGFSHAASVYPHNPVGSWSKSYGYQIAHNMEYMTAEAIKFINNNAHRNFFMYFNPTVPHVSSNVGQVLRNGDCRQTVAGLQPTPVVPDANGNNIMSGNCRAYRQTVINRAQTGNDKEMGTIWLDDAMGHLFTALEANGIMDETCFVFQMDHGQEGKGTLFDQGVRIAQFVYCPALGYSGTFDGLVSTIDTAPSLLQASGITPSYQMDGKSWANAVLSTGSVLQSWRDRCIFYELNFDRGVKCGCYVYMDLEPANGKDSWTRTMPLFSTQSRPQLASGREQFYRVCNANDRPYYSPAANPQSQGGPLVNSQPQRVESFREVMTCFKQRTNPNGVPHYGTCQLSGNAGGGGGPSQPSPSQPSPSQPSPSQPSPSQPSGSSCQDSSAPFKLLRYDRYETCSWVRSVAAGTVQRQNRCNNYGELCPATCNQCSPSPGPPSPSQPSPSQPSPSQPSPGPPGPTNYDCSTGSDPSGLVTLPRGYQTQCGAWFLAESYRCESYGYLCPYLCNWCTTTPSQPSPSQPSPSQPSPSQPSPSQPSPSQPSPSQPSPSQPSPSQPSPSQPSPSQPSPSQPSPSQPSGGGSCQDNSTPFELKLYPGQFRTCRWVDAAPAGSNFRRNRCNNYGDLCPDTCNQC